MRAGACAVQQTLSPEASSVLKHSLLLSRRRGHAQLTPLHVAATLLTCSSRFAAILKSSCSPHIHHSHPLQCRALELCLNVSLNRLPAGGGPLLLQSPPSLSNSLIAALKRAQAHQRRSGCAEQQQQQNCFLTIKVDLDELIISILDDPSVSRVMREAGFSSTCVKTNLEDCRKKSVNFWRPSLVSERNPTKSVFDVLLGTKKRKSIVLVGENSSVAEGLASQVMAKLEKGDVDHHHDLKSVKLIRLQFSAVPLRFMTRQEVDMNVGDLKRKVESYGSRGRVIICVGDLKWAVERGDECSTGFYSPVDHLIAEIGDMVSWYNNSSSRVWLMGSANYETFTKCKTKEPCLDVQWDLEAVHVPPSGGLGLNLNVTSSLLDSTTLSKDNIVLSCCPECLSNFEKENPPSAQLPYWLRNSLHNKEGLVQLTTKYNSICQSLHGPPRYYTPNNHHQSSLDSLRSREAEEVIKTTLSLGNPHAADDKLSVDLRNAIQENVPWQFEGIPLILEALMDVCSKAVGGDRLLLVRGNDVVGKRRLAAGIAKSVFGSSDSLLHVSMRNTFANCENGNVLDTVLKKHHEEIVVLVEDVDCADPDLMKFLVDGAAKDYRRAIFVLTMDGDTGYYNVNTVVRMKLLVHESKHGLRMSDFDHKRKSDRDLAFRIKSQRISKCSEMVKSSPNVTIEFSSNVFDLNVKANEDEDEDEDERGQFSPISSDLTREVTIEQQSSLMFLERIKYQLVFNRDSDKDERAREMLLSKLKTSFRQASDDVTSFEVEENLLEEVVRRSGFYHNDLFEKWVHGVFRTSLGMLVGVGKGSGKVLTVRLCLDGKSGDSCGNEGFMGTCLPKMIPLCFI